MARMAAVCVCCYSRSCADVCYHINTLIHDHISCCDVKLICEPYDRAIALVMLFF